MKRELKRLFDYIRTLYKVLIKGETGFFFNRKGDRYVVENVSCSCYSLMKKHLDNSSSVLLYTFSLLPNIIITKAQLKKEPTQEDKEYKSKEVYISLSWLYWEIKFKINKSYFLSNGEKEEKRY